MTVSGPLRRDITDGLGGPLGQLALTRLGPAPTIRAMYILTRYVAWEVVKYFLAALVTLTLIFTLGIGVKRGILDEGFPPLLMLQSIPYLMPEILGITIPVAMLFSVSSVFGRMTGANEIVALKSLGISPMAAVWPVLALAAFTSLGTIWMYEITATKCRPGFRRLAYDSIEEIVYSRLQKKSSYDGDLFFIAVKRVESRGDRRVLIQPTITLKSQPGRPKVTITAAEAELHTNHKSHALDIICRNGEIDVEGHVRMSFSDEQTYSVPIPAPTWDHRHRDWVAMQRRPGLIAEIEAEIASLRKSRASIEKLGEANKALGIASPHQGAESDRRPDRRPIPPHLPLEDRAIPPVVERFHLLVLRPDRHAGGHAVAPRRRPDQLLRLFPADLGRILPAVDDRRGPVDLGHSAADFVLDGQRDSGDSGRDPLAPHCTPLAGRVAEDGARRVARGRRQGEHASGGAGDRQLGLPAAAEPRGYQPCSGMHPSLKDV